MDDSFTLLRTLIAAHEAKEAASYAESLAWVNPLADMGQRVVAASYNACDAQYAFDQAYAAAIAHVEATEAAAFTATGELFGDEA